MADGPDLFSYQPEPPPAAPEPVPKPAAARVATVAVFPTTRNRPRLMRTARFMLSVPPKHAEGHLREQLRRLSVGLHNKGIPADLVDAEVRAYEAGIRATVWQLSAREDGGAA